VVPLDVRGVLVLVIYPAGVAGCDVLILDKAGFEDRNGWMQHTIDRDDEYRKKFQERQEQLKSQLN
jgi:hypothetical protein